MVWFIAIARHDSQTFSLWKKKSNDNSYLSFFDSIAFKKFEKEGPSDIRETGPCVPVRLVVNFVDLLKSQILANNQLKFINILRGNYHLFILKL